MNFKHTGLFPGAGRELGLRHGADPRGGPSHPRAEPLRLHRRRDRRLREGGGVSVCHVDAAKGMVAWAKENARCSGLAECADPLDRGRLRQVRGAGDPPRQDVRRHHHGPAQLRPRPRRRGVEAGGEPVSLREALRPGAVGSSLCSLSSTATPPAWPRRCWAISCSCWCGRKFGGRVAWDELGLPCTDSGMALPCGATGRWMCR